MEPISWPELGQTSRARVLRALCEAGQAGMNGPDIRRATDHGDYRKRIRELITEDDIPVDRARVPARNWKRYTLKVSPGEAVRTFLLRPHRKSGETKDTASGGGSDAGPLLNAKQGVVEEAQATHSAAQVLGKRSAAVRANRANAPHTAPGGLTWSEYRAKKKEDQLCLT